MHFGTFCGPHPFTLNLTFKVRNHVNQKGGLSCSLVRGIDCDHPFNNRSAFSGRFAVPRLLISTLTFKVKSHADKVGGLSWTSGLFAFPCPLTSNLTSKAKSHVTRVGSLGSSSGRGIDCDHPFDDRSVFREVFEFC